ncbi:MAG: hypothetical protein NTW95_00510 [Candidatus Aminicenantes bacterium]|nr:hypothetical protein [Candidatus Aminicenantes bacterium]
MGKVIKTRLVVILFVCFLLGSCKKADDTFNITQADVEYISRTILWMMHLAQEDAISDAVANIPLGQLGGPIDWTPGGNYNGIHIQGSVMGHTDYSADADTSIHLAAVNLDPFDSRAMSMEIVQGDGTIITHVDKGWLQETFNVNLTLRLLAVNYDVSFVSDIIYFDLANVRLTGEVIFNHTTYNINISFLPSM